MSEPAEPKVLIIDDDPSIRNLYKTKLENEGYTVLVAKEGSEGFMFAKTKKPDLILLDLLMPGVDGPMFLKILNDEKKTKDIPVIVLTNKGEFKDEIEEYGVAGYLVKANTTPKKVVEKIKEILPAAPKPKAPKPALKMENTEEKRIKIPREKVLERKKKEAPPAPPAPEPEPETEAEVLAEKPKVPEPKPEPEKPLTEEELIEAQLFELRQKSKRGVKELPSEQKRIFKKNYRILLVEDDPIISRLYRTKLELEDQTVLYAPTGQSALDIIKSQHPDFVLLDIQMPDMTGIEVLEELKKAAINNIPIIVFTNSEDEHTQKKSLELGALDYMNKAATTPTQMIKRINEILSAPKEKPEE